MDGARLILSSRYLKSGSDQQKAKRKQYTKYIATRETVEVREQEFRHTDDPATDNQKTLLYELLSEFPESKTYLEYGDYRANPTDENASELISAIIERNADVIGNRQNFVGYIAMRPGAERRGAHGLFNGSDAPIVLNRVADEVANHPGNVWSHVVSLRREDAIRLGYDNSDRWRDLVMRHLNDIAAAHNIPLGHLKWYAAFHNTTHHPHIHLIVYSANPKQGFLTNTGIEKMRSCFANDIFHDDLQSIYEEQTLRRDELKVLSVEEFHAIAEQIQLSTFDNPKLTALVNKLHEQLKNTKGKKVYGYLPKEVKQTVDAVFAELAQDQKIALLYEKWCDLERLKYKSYMQREPVLPPLAENKVFQPVRNMIIRTVAEMTLNPQIVRESGNPEDHRADDFMQPENDQSEVNVKRNPYHLKWSADYKKACRLMYKQNPTDAERAECVQLLQNEAKLGNLLALHDLGKLFASGYCGQKDRERSDQYYRAALDGFQILEPSAGKMQPYIQYRIGKMFVYGLGTEQDDAKAFAWFLKSAKAGNMFAQHSLANLYRYGRGTPQNLTAAVFWYRKAAEQEQPYAAYAIAQMFETGEAVPLNDETAQKYYTQAMEGFLKLLDARQIDDNLLCRIGSMYEHGLGTGKDAVKALEYYHRSAETGNDRAAYLLGRMLLFGADGIEPDREQALYWLSVSAENGNPYAESMIENMGKYESEMLADTVFSLFVSLSSVIEDDYNNRQRVLHSQVDRKLRRMIQRQKEAIGLKSDGQQYQ